MHFFDLVNDCLRRRPFVPFRIATSAGTTLPVADPALLTYTKADSILNLMHRDVEGVWVDVAIRGTQVVSIEVPSMLHGDETPPTSPEPKR